MSQLSAARAPELEVRELGLESAMWLFRVGVEARVWDWRDGPPDPRQLDQYRTPKARALSKHVPGAAFSVTTGGTLQFESGLEHLLIRTLDRDRRVRWLLAQPFELRFRLAGGRSIRHVPDLLSLSDDGVTVWDARAEQRRGTRFRLQTRLTQIACDHVGWSYRLFGEPSRVAAVNLTWLGCYRQIPARGLVHQDRLRAGLVDGTIQTIGDVAKLDSGSGDLLAAMWHHIWRGDIECDLDSPFRQTTELFWADTEVVGGE
jgi:hypothetical protein